MMKIYDYEVVRDYLATHGGGTVKFDREIASAEEAFAAFERIAAELRDLTAVKYTVHRLGFQEGLEVAANMVEGHDDERGMEDARDIRGLEP